MDGGGLQHTDVIVCVCVCRAYIDGVLTGLPRISKTADGVRLQTVAVFAKCAYAATCVHVCEMFRALHTFGIYTTDQTHVYLCVKHFNDTLQHCYLKHEYRTLAACHSSKSSIIAMQASHLVKEVIDTTEFLHKRGNLADFGSSAVSLRQSLAESMATQIVNLQTLPPKEAGVLLDSLGGNAYGEFTTRVTAAIDSRLACTASSAVRKGAKTKPQISKLPNKFCSKPDVGVFRNPKINLHTKLSVLVHRLNRLGITNPHEKTLRWWLAYLILLHFQEIPSGKETYKIVQDCKEVVESERKPYPYQHMVHYPEHPSELSDEMLKYAYDEDNQPTEVDVQGLAAMADKMVMRSNHRLMKEEPSSAEPHKARDDKPLTRQDVRELLNQEREVQTRLDEARRGSFG